MPTASIEPGIALVTADTVGAATGRFAHRGRTYPCALGRAGIALVKREGDGVTPAGVWPVRRVLYRADRLCAPCPGSAPIAADDGWCDTPEHPLYNCPVKHPFAASAEHLWRDDGLYDVVVVLGHNDAPVVAGAGSAIFLHVAKADYAPTAGCVALALPDLLAVLAAGLAGLVIHTDDHTER